MVRTPCRAHRGFTLIELLVTVVIVSILASAAVPLMDLAAQRSKELELRRVLREIRRGLDAYKQAVNEGRVMRKMGESGYPHALADLEAGVLDAKDPSGKRIYFLRRLPRDPLYPDPSAPAEKTWGKRSYASPPDNPREGEDVFDVYSLSEGIGLNGIPYRQW
ncbi:MAG: type II secretion system protein [Betaproteobacteria bacterium]|nr:type II secretion system protein [Betaproteobacteria bacterium]